MKVKGQGSMLHVNENSFADEYWRPLQSLVIHSMVNCVFVIHVTPGTC